MATKNMQDMQEIEDEVAMTPTEQDKELRGAIVHYRIKCDYYLSDRDEGVISQEVYEAAISSELDSVVHLITADRKRVALEARIDELENRLRVQFISSHWARLCAEVNSWAKYVDRRIAELKAQQEEV